MTNHTACDHPATKAARARCRRANKIGSPPIKRGNAESGNVESRAVPDEDKQRTCKDPTKACHNCGIRKIEYFGISKWNAIRAFFCGKCAYAFDIIRPVEID